MKLLIFARPLMLTLFVFLISSIAINAQTTVFTYQGRLTDTSMPASGTYDLQFALYSESGTQVGTTTTRDDITVSNGVFTVQLDFGSAAFPGSNRVLEIGVRRGAETGAFTILAPRQPITSAPYAIRALSAANAAAATTATNAQQLGGVAANQFAQTNSAAFIRNQTSPQTSASFNIDGTGAANIFNAQTQYNIGGNRVLSVVGSNNLFAGVRAGSANTTGFYNSFLGSYAGYSNTDSNSNSFVGSYAGYANTTGSGNLFAGSFAGYANTSGSGNLFLGNQAGYANTTGGGNSFVGNNAGRTTTIGTSNSFVGGGAGDSNTTGYYNSFFGAGAGGANTTGGLNTMIGYTADVGSNDLTHATAIGARSLVSTSNTIAMGRPGGIDKVVIYGLGAGGSTTLCRNAALQISTCSSSLRYKNNIASFSFGLNVVKQLRPISFNWKEGGMKDVGFGAEDVAQINPLLVTYNEKGEVEGVKYDRLSVVFVNAFKEQQSQIEQQNQQIKQQQQQIDGLKKIVCGLQPQAEVCR